jgi:prepilin-type processing-associated H-X9-DG protein
MVEESGSQGYNIDDWAFQVGQYKSGSQLEMDGPIAVWHGQSSTFAFADGHGEKHKWQQEQIENQSTKLQMNRSPEADFLYQGFLPEIIALRLRFII